MTPARVRVGEALTALAVLAYRLGAERTMVLELRSPQRVYLCRVPVELEPAQPLSVLRDQVTRALGTVDVRELLREVATVCWHEKVGHQDGAALELELDLLTLQLIPEHSRVEGLLVLDDPWSVLTQHWNSALAALRADSRSQLRDVVLLSDAERAVLQRFANPVRLEQALLEGSLHGCFEQVVARYPERTAIEVGGLSTTYAALNAHAEAIARTLAGRGIGRGHFVALRLGRSVELVASLLGVLKTGAAYVPLDPDWPLERVQWILEDCQAAAVLVSSAPADGSLAGSMVDVSALLAAPPPGRWEPRSAEPDQPCYAIYTSGTTGQPKGVVVSHRSARHLVEVERELFGARPEDRVLQGFSPAFDAAVEELWLALAAGGALVVATKHELVEDFSALVARARITVLTTVPTLLATATGPLPTVRVLILGGESCLPELVERFATPSCAMFNTWGPTEATVIATAGRLVRGAPVTIGTPIANTWVGILDDDLQPVPPGAAGQLFIGGVCLATGYLGRADLTAERFIQTRGVMPGCPARIYATGDRGRYNARGEIEFLGRLDGQVKLRGFRIELEEVEIALARHASVARAVTQVRQDERGDGQLVAWVVQGVEAVGEAELKTWLRATLPAYMVPTRIQTLPAFPVLTSGKVDRRALETPTRAVSEHPHPGEEESSPLEATILTCWRRTLGLSVISPDDDFFLDLGGHSLLAARVVSALREEEAGLGGLSVATLYQHPTAARLARHIGHQRIVTAENPMPVEHARPVASHLRGALLQLLGLYPLTALFGLQWLVPYLAHAALIAEGWAEAGALGVAALTVVGTTPAMLLFAVVAKWLVLGRVRAGTYPLWGTMFVRWWFVQQVVKLAPVSLLEGTPWLNVWLRLMGARVHPTAYLMTDVFAAFDLLEIGAGTTVCEGASLSGAWVEGGALHVGPVQLGRDCHVGARSVVSAWGRLSDGASLGPLSLVPRGTTVPQGQHWEGSPARPEVGSPRPAGPPTPTPRVAFTVAAALGVGLTPLVLGAALLPGLLLYRVLTADRGPLATVAAAPLVALAFTASLCTLTVLLKWLLLGRVTAGQHPTDGWFAWRKWFFGQLMAMSLDVVGPLYATLYVVPWFRLLGAQVGRGAELSTLTSAEPDLLRIGANAFIADAVSLGATDVDRGVMTLRRTEVRDLTFVGNSAVVPAGTMLGDDCLVGCLSVPPRQAAARSKPGSAWLGSPAVTLPRRQQSSTFATDATFSPPRARVWLRLVIEAIRVVAPGAGIVVFTASLLSLAVSLRPVLGLAGLFAVFPFLYVGCAVPAVLASVVAKWALVGRYREAEYPLWSLPVWRSELVTALLENLANTLLLDLLVGTPFIVPFFRLLGAKMGARVYLDSTEMTEYDLIELGDEAEINGDATLQTHLFEDRVMKMSRLRVGARCTVGESAVVLYDTEMKPGSGLGALSLLMKGESLPPDTHWEGSPAVRRRDEVPGGT